MTVSKKVQSLYQDVLGYAAYSCVRVGGESVFKHVKDKIKYVDDLPLEESFMCYVIDHTRELFSKAFIDWEHDFKLSEDEVAFALNRAITLGDATNTGLYPSKGRVDFMTLVMVDINSTCVYDVYNKLCNAFVKPMSYDTLVSLPLIIEDGDDDSDKKLAHAYHIINSTSACFNRVVEEAANNKAREEALRKARQKRQEEERLKREAEAAQLEERRQAALQAAREEHMKKITAPAKVLTREERKAIYAAEQAAKLKKAKTRG